MDKKKIIVVGLILAAIIAFFAFDLQQYFTLENIKAQQQNLTDQYKANPVVFIAVFLVTYIATAAFSLPIISLLTLLAGAIFGLVLGVIIVSFASTIGATLAFLVSRFLARDWVQGKLGSKLNAINEGVERDGAFYLFTLRLVPAFPFWVINLLMGLTKLKTFTFLLGQPGRYVARHDRLCECGYAVGAD